MAKYLRFLIGGDPVDVDIEKLPVSISYKLEDPDNFQTKQSSTALSVVIPATRQNDQRFNTFHDPQVNDMTPDQMFKNHRPVVISCEGYELFTGKALLKSAEYDTSPRSYEIDCYGNNGDWSLDLDATTLFDLLKHITFTFNTATIEASWLFDGTDENLPYVFAPVRYSKPFGGYNFIDDQRIPVDNDVAAVNLRPALSVYWILYWAFKSVGYKIESDFFETEYFRRLVMPWTWGGFLADEGSRLNLHKFLARGVNTAYMNHQYDGFVDLSVTDDNSPANGTFDSNDDYSYNAGTKEMVWQYKPEHFAKINVRFSLTLAAEGLTEGNSDVVVRVDWKHTDSVGITISATSETLIRRSSGRRWFDTVSSFFEKEVDPDDKIICKVYAYVFEGKSFAWNVSRSWLNLKVDEFKIDSISKPLNGLIDFQDYPSLKRYKFLDFLRGVIDTFNLSVQTDSVNKTVRIEPTHPYSLQHDLSVREDGYFKAEDVVDWSIKQDLSKKSKLALNSDGEREKIFRYKDDSNDGILKKIQDRHTTKLGAAKYVLPARFKKGDATVENRFFSPLMHYDAEQFESITGTAPQLPVIIPENISNTSAPEAENTFQPKLAYYKGLTAGVGGWKYAGVDQTDLPFMFSVNYKAGGHNDPILSYSDELIDGIVGKGLLRRFYLQRMATLREGITHETWYCLGMFEVTNFLHREPVVTRGLRWELIEISNFLPLQDQSTKCFLRKVTLPDQQDSDSIFPSADSINGGSASDPFDLKYQPLKCLTSDIIAL